MARTNLERYESIKLQGEQLLQHARTTLKACNYFSRPNPNLVGKDTWNLVKKKEEFRKFIFKVCAHFNAFLSTARNCQNERAKIVDMAYKFALKRETLWLSRNLSHSFRKSQENGAALTWLESIPLLLSKVFLPCSWQSALKQHFRTCLWPGKLPYDPHFKGKEKSLFESVRCERKRGKKSVSEQTFQCQKLILADLISNFRKVHTKIETVTLGITSGVFSCFFL